MFINALSHYLPEMVVSNAHFENLNGLSNDWIVGRTGIQERRRASVQENTNTMAVEAVRQGLATLPYDVQEIDLIVGATYTPYDTIVTLAHVVQHDLQIPEIPVVSVSTACSSLINAIEVVEGYFCMGKARRALVVVSDHNTAYSNESDKIAGHLWGDGAAALFISKERLSDSDLYIRDVLTGGAATVGKAIEGVTMRPLNGGVNMPQGRDVFQNAVIYMPKASRQVLQRNGLSVDDVDWVLPHQANFRISKKVMEELGLPMEKLLSNIQYLGNTGCAGCAIGLDENKFRYQKGDRIIVTTFGGGYSYGAMLVEV
ncbi:MAG: ketoacyl-ACP synthase III [Cytophagaceae bacterium]|nr:ketoacyl-ACP synthase III [Cytophagaceae bacterium]